MTFADNARMLNVIDTIIGMLFPYSAIKGAGSVANLPTKLQRPRAKPKYYGSK
jgi:hypothetical protein